MLSKSSKRTFSKKKKIETEQEERKTRSQLKKFSLNKLGNPETEKKINMGNIRKGIKENPDLSKHKTIFDPIPEGEIRSNSSKKNELINSKSIASSEKKLSSSQKKKNQKENKEKYSSAIEKLQEYSLPESIPCREHEKKDIHDFLIEGIQNKGLNQTLYISGIPGIGKTVSFLEVIKNLQNSKENNFQFIKINGMSLKDPENIYLILLEEITGIKNVSRGTACILLSKIKFPQNTLLLEKILKDNLFRNNKLPKQYSVVPGNQSTKIILLDELDYLFTRDQTILYNLFEWPHLKYSHMVMTGIANTVDFPERLQPKIASRIGNRRLTYKPYSASQIAQIINERIITLDKVFSDDAVTFVSKKVCVFSSDIRRTLNVCRKAVEICQENGKKDDYTSFRPIEVSEIREAYDSLYKSVYIECLKQFNDLQKILLIALALENKHQEIGRVSFYKIYDRLCNMFTALGDNRKLKISEILQMFYQMMNANLLIVKEQNIIQTKKNNKNKITFTNIKDYDVKICISTDDITNALKDEKLLEKFLYQF